MSDLLFCALCILFVIAIVALCFLMDSKRGFQKGYKDGYNACGQDAAQWLRAQDHHHKSPTHGGILS